MKCRPACGPGEDEEELRADFQRLFDARKAGEG